MKIVTSQQMAEIEKAAYRDGSSDSEFMEEAGRGVALLVHEFVEKHNLDKQVVLLCGKGNNAGDAFVAGIHLLHMQYDVYALQVVPSHLCSHLCQKNHARFLKEGGISREVSSEEEIAFPLNGIIVDGLFGTGFHGTVEEPFAVMIKLANQSQLPIIAIDIPSGLNGDTGKVENIAIKASETAYLGLPKAGFFLQEGWNHVGKLRYVDFGLPQQYIEESATNFFMLSHEMVSPLMPEIVPNRHKYEAGYVVGLSGSPGMPGAPILSCWSALSGGAGIVRLLHPEGMQAELAASPYEVIKTSYNPENITPIIEQLNKASAVFIGPALGLGDGTKKMLKKILSQLERPCVIDADALTLIAENQIKLPRNSILTPHKGEMDRLLHLPHGDTIDFDYLKKCQRYAEEHEVTLLLKGGPTFIFHADESMIVSPVGDPGMATAGSGDVLTGLIAALLAQKLIPYHAALLGVYLHGLAGEFAADEKTSYCMLASDIIKHYPDAFRALSRTL